MGAPKKPVALKECGQRWLHPRPFDGALGQSIDTKERYLNMAMKLTRMLPMQMEALNRHRGKIPNPLIVGNVNVNDGGQAIVGSVNHQAPGKVSDEGKEVGGRKPRKPKRLLK